jgi:hypothetical protein
MKIDGSVAQAIEVAKGEKPAHDAAMAGDGSFEFAWYTSIGKLEHYRSTTATFDANEQGDGAVVVVVRDGQGGVAWQIVPASIH